MECETMFTRTPLFASLMDSSFSSRALECERLLCLQQVLVTNCKFEQQGSICQFNSGRVP